MSEESATVDAGEIYVVGLGPGDPIELPPLNLSLMRRGREVYLRTGRHPVVSFLEKEGIRLRSLDDFYQKAKSFEEVYRRMADFLINAARRGGPVVFGVPGHPAVGEAVVRRLLGMAPQKGVRVRLWPAPSFLEAVFTVLGLDPAQGLMIADGFELCRLTPAASSFDAPQGRGILVAQIYNRLLASEIKLTLMEHFPDDHPVAVVRAAGVRGEERVKRIPLYQLDRLQDLNHLTTLYVPPFPLGKGEGKSGGEIKSLIFEISPAPAAGKQQSDPASETPQTATPGMGAPGRYVLDPLVEVMERLLAPGGCPWDRQQTHQTLKKYLIEEAYEVLDAIDEENMHKLCEELGDLLLQVVFHTALAAARGDFNLTQVIEGITEKLRRRHPHVFGTEKVKSAAQVLANWEAIKQEEKEKEKGAEIRAPSLLAGVPRCLPALQRAQKVQGKAALVGFDWPDARGAAEKLEEEWQELRTAWARGDEEAVRVELGDLFFAAVNVARLLQVNAEEALRSAVDKLIKRFRYMEEKAQAEGLKLRGMSDAELDSFWEEAKAREKFNT